MAREGKGTRERLSFERLLVMGLRFWAGFVLFTSGGSDAGVGGE